MQNENTTARIMTSHNEKIMSLISNEDIKQKVMLKLQAENIIHPALKLEILHSETQHIQMHEFDILKVFESFGEVKSIEILNNSAIILFNDLVSAYFALKILNQKSLPELNLTLQISWHKTVLDLRLPLSEVLLTPVEGLKNPEVFDESLKYTIRFNIRIDNDAEFKVARRLIGSKGCNMKRIIDKCCLGMKTPAHDVLKLRLRGKGSGFREGPNSQESDEDLHMCVSSKYYNKLLIAVNEIEKLLKKVYAEYDKFCMAKGKNPPMLRVEKIEKISGKTFKLSPRIMKEIEESRYLTEDQVEELINIRNEARRQYNFAEADRIREILRGKGIVLMDEKGMKGKGHEVTTWKYSQI